MTIDARKPVLTLQGKPYKEQTEVVSGQEPQEPKDLTIGSVISQVLATVKSANPIQSHTLAMKFYSEEEVEIKPEDAVFIKKQFEDPNVGFFPFIVGQVFKELDK